MSAADLRFIAIDLAVLTVAALVGCTVVCWMIEGGAL